MQPPPIDCSVPPPHEAIRRHNVSPSGNDSPLLPPDTAEPLISPKRPSSAKIPVTNVTTFPSPTLQPTNTRRRGDIDGIRAIATIVIVLYHLRVSLFTSGFIFVDVFFVIAGYLMMHSLCRKISPTAPEFSLRVYLHRRVWRLLPALLFICIVSTIVGFLLFSYTDYLALTRSLVAVTSFSAFNHFASLDTGYFGPNTRLIPLLHCWSLSVEWVWYLILPILVVIVQPQYRYTCMAFVFFVSVVGTVLPPLNGNPRPSSEYGKHYFSFLDRVFELSFGGMIAGPFFSNIAHATPRLIKNLVGLGSLIGLVIISTLNIHHAYPNEHALLVVLLSALLLLVGDIGIDERRQPLFSRILGCWPLRTIGRMSYSIYLVHYPTMCFFFLVYVPNNALSVLVFVSILVVMILISYFGFERPFLKGSKSDSHLCGSLTFILLPILISFIIAFGTEHFPETFFNLTESDRVIMMIDKVGARERMLHIYDNEQCTRLAGSTTTCRFNTPENDVPLFKRDDGLDLRRQQRRALLVGDSHAGAFTWFVREHAYEQDIYLDVYSTASCAILLNTTQKSHYDPHQCEKAKSALKRDSKRYDYVILSNFWSHYINPYVTDSHFMLDYPGKIGSESYMAAFESSLNATIAHIVASGTVPIFLGDVYDITSTNKYRSSSITPSSCILQRELMGMKRSCAIYDNSHKDPVQKTLRGILSRMKEQYPTLLHYEIKDVFCKNGECPVELNHYPVFSDDSGHISWYASYSFGFHTSTSANIFLPSNSQKEAPTIIEDKLS